MTSSTVAGPIIAQYLGKIMSEHTIEVFQTALIAFAIWNVINIIVF